MGGGGEAVEGGARGSRERLAGPRPQRGRKLWTTREPRAEHRALAAETGACQLEITLAESKSPMWRRQLAGILACRRSRDLSEKTLCSVNPQFPSEHAA